MAVDANPGLVAPTTEEQIAYFDIHISTYQRTSELRLLGIFGHAPTGRGTIFISRSKFLSYRGGARPTGQRARLQRATDASSLCQLLALSLLWLVAF